MSRLRLPVNRPEKKDSYRELNLLKMITAISRPIMTPLSQLECWSTLDGSTIGNWETSFIDLLAIPAAGSCILLERTSLNRSASGSGNAFSPAHIHLLCGKQWMYLNHMISVFLMLKIYACIMPARLS